MTPTPLSAIRPLTAEMLKNGTYTLPQFGETVTLADGAYDRAASNEDILHVALLDPIAFGDLDGDGAEDAAVMLSENGGGTGFFVSVIVMLNQGGVPVQSASRLIDDRPHLTDLSIQDGRILVDAVIHGVQDPMCCPNFTVQETLRLQNNQLLLTHFTSATADNQVREIRITAPAPGAVVSASIAVNGTVTIIPFEGTLVYAVHDAAGNSLTNGSFTVHNGEMGTPGTFDASIDISMVPAGTTIRLKITDLSAADGSVLAMDSVVYQVN